MVVSLDAQTTRGSFSVAAARKMLKVLAMFVRKVTSSVARPGAGIAAMCATASWPASASTVSPMFVRSA